MFVYSVGISHVSARLKGSSSIIPVIYMSVQFRGWANMDEGRRSQNGMELISGGKGESQGWCWDED